MVALTSPVGATGVFDLDLQPELLLPFEGLGVDTTWQLELPPAGNPFNFASIADVVLGIDYTALADLDYRTVVCRQLNQDRQRSVDQGFSLRDDFPDAFYGLLNPTDPTGSRAASITVMDTDIPSVLSDVAVDQIAVYVSPAVAGVNITLAFGPYSGTGTTDGDGVVSTRRGNAPAGWSQITTETSTTEPYGIPPQGTWTITFDEAGGSLLDRGAITDVQLFITVQRECPALVAMNRGQCGGQHWETKRFRSILTANRRVRRSPWYSGPHLTIFSRSTYGAEPCSRAATSPTSSSL